MRRNRKARARRVADAASFIFLSRQDRNPYELDYHKRVTDDDGSVLWECPQVDLFDDDEKLLSEAILVETYILSDGEIPAHGPLTFFECPACAASYALWSSIIEATGDASWGHRAFAALDLDSYIEDFRPDMSEIDAEGWRDVKAIRAERARLDAQRQYNQQQEVKRTASK